MLEGRDEPIRLQTGKLYNHGHLSANEIQERRAERAFANSRGRGVPRASARMRLFYQPASTRTNMRGDTELPQMGFIYL